MLFQTKNGELELSLTDELKNRVLVLFAKAYELNKKKATLADIKKEFPKYNLRKSLCEKSDRNKIVAWYDILGCCLEKIEAKEIAEEKKAANTPVFSERETEFYEAAKKYDCKLNHKETIGGLSYSVSKNNETLGRIGYDYYSQRYYFCLGRFGCNTYVGEKASTALYNLLYNRGLVAA